MNFSSLLILGTHPLIKCTFFAMLSSGFSSDFPVSSSGPDSLLSSFDASRKFC